MVTLSSEFDPSHGIFSSKSTYNADDVAWIISGLNIALQKGGQSVKGFAAKMLPAFYEITLNLIRVTWPRMNSTELTA